MASSLPPTTIQGQGQTEVILPRTSLVVPVMSQIKGWTPAGICFTKQLALSYEEPWSGASRTRHRRLGRLRGHVRG